MAGIQLSGLASGLDTQSLIAQLMAAERQPRTQITNKQAADNARESVLKDLTTKLKALDDASTALASPATWAPVQPIDSSDPTKIAVTQLSGSGPGSYQVAVTQLASADQHTYTYTPPTSADSIMIGTERVPLAANATVDDAVSAINSDTNAKVFAVNVSGSLVLAARATGTANAFAATGGSLSEQASKARPAKDALYTVDGGAQQTSSSNVVTDAVPGAQLTLKGVSPGVTVTVGNPGVDTGAVTTKLKAFVDAYNTAMTSMRSAEEEQPSKSNPTLGSLYGDTGISSAMDALRNSVSQVFSGIGNPAGFQLMSQIGLSTGATTGSAAYNPDSVAGKLTLDTTALTAALGQDPQSVQRLLGAATGVSGFAQAIHGAVDPYSQAGGIMDQQVSSNEADLRDLASQLTEFDARMTQKQSILQTQFTALETALSKLHSQSAQMASSLGLTTTTGF